MKAKNVNIAVNVPVFGTLAAFIGKMKKLISILAVATAALALTVQPASAQNILNRLGQRAKNAIENNVGRKVEKGINDVLDGNVGKNNDNGNQNNSRSKQETAQEEHNHAAEGWTCPECGHTGNTGKFCTQCGAKKPDGNAAASSATQRQGNSGNAGSAIRSNVALGGVPNPYTTFDTPENPFDVALGLPENDEGDKPAMRRVTERVSYAAYTYPALGARGKEFYNADRRRLYNITFEMWQGKPRVTKFLAVIDSLAIYQIDDEAKTITKFPLSEIQTVASHNLVSSTHILQEEDIASSQGRWCYRSSGARENTYDIAGHEVTETSGQTSYADLETGIVLEVTQGYDHDYTRNIHLGLFYPEIYDLPEGYRMITVDFSDAMRKMDQMEEGMKSFEEQMKGLDLQNKSVDELLKML